MRPPALPFLLLAALLPLPLAFATAGTALDPAGDQSTALATASSFRLPGAPLACADGATDLTGLRVESVGGRVTVRLDVADLESPGVACGGRVVPLADRAATVWATSDGAYAWTWWDGGRASVVVCLLVGDVPCVVPEHAFAAEEDALTWTFPVAAAADASCACPAYDLAGQRFEAVAGAASYALHDPWTDGWPGVEVRDETGPLWVTL